MKVIVAKSAGFCYGVKRAVELAQNMTKETGRFWMLGDLIHNIHVVKELESRGVYKTQDTDSLGVGDTVLIRSHGERKNIFDQLKSQGVRCINATCPNVRRIQELVAQAEKEGRQAVIIGDPQHPEVMGVASWCKHPLIFDSPEAVQEWLKNNPNYRQIPLTLVAQTTCIREIFENSWKILKKECTNIKKFDTICNATRKRQTEAALIAEQVDVMVVVGDRKSANTRHLTEICQKKCRRVFQLENAQELSPEMVKGCTLAGLTAGASTPAGIIKEVYAAMSEEIKVNGELNAGEETTETEETKPSAASDSAEEKEEDSENFAELLEQSIKTLNTGDKVTGTVKAIGSTEVEVDVGAKQTAYIKFSELSGNPDVKPEDVVKVGDEIEAFVTRVNDVEGYAELSKRRLDTEKNWETIEKAKEEKTVVEGKVVDKNSGGIIVNINGVRVFVPASQSGKRSGTDLSTMMNETVKLRIIEVNRSRRRVVGSIRSVREEERRAAQEELWTNIEVGKRYTGTVKSIISYGVFVDIGGVDGMVHISELSWSRIKDPHEVCNIGDTLEVYVISFDTEKRKISLGVKDHSIDPWSEFMKKYSEGDIAPVRIVKLMSFGAFAEVVPGVDGLIHISQIADQRIDRPEDVLSEGQIVNAKIIAVDEEKKKISLSIRAVPLSFDEQEEGIEGEEDEPDSL